MKLDHVEAIAVEIPLTKNFGGSTYSVLKRSTARRDRALGRR